MCESINFNVFIFLIFKGCDKKFWIYLWLRVRVRYAIICIKKIWKLHRKQYFIQYITILHNTMLIVILWIQFGSFVKVYRKIYHDIYHKIKVYKYESINIFKQMNDCNCNVVTSWYHIRFTVKRASLINAERSK